MKCMKNQRIPEHKLNTTNTVDSLLENLDHQGSGHGLATEQTATEAAQDHSNEAK